MIITALLAVVAIMVGVVYLGDTWYQLILAAMLGVVLAQFGFLGHEAAHQQVFDSPKWNQWVGRILAGLCTGLSYGWRTRKGKIQTSPPGYSSSPRKQAIAAPAGWQPSPDDKASTSPLLFFEGLSLYIASIRALTTKPALKQRWPGLAFLTVRHVSYVVFLFVVLPPAMAVAFFAVQVGGFLLGAA